MGRPYKQELEAITGTNKFAKKFDISILTSFFSSNCNIPLLIIGSGGSYAVAKGFELCYQSYGGFAKTVTPYGLQDEKYIIGNSKVLIVTAGGNNPDTVSVYNYIRLYEPFEICVVCLSEKSKISRLVHKYKDAILFETSIPFGKDGYLAVNSSVSMFHIIRKLMAPLEGNTDKNIEIVSLREEKSDISEILRKCTNLVVVYGGWGTPAAFDLESKCSEAGLINVQFVDYRNFAHGRHNWIDKMCDVTAIIAISTPKEQKIRDKTLMKLPDKIPKIFLSTDKNGSVAALELLIQVFYLVDILGDIKGIDPGRPQVPEYGSQLYHIKYNLKIQDTYLKSILKNKKEYCIYRKMRGMQDSQWHDYYCGVYDSFVESLLNENYGALLLDFDGTVIDCHNKNIPKTIVGKLNELLNCGITVGFATGRGDSIVDPLRNIIREEFWNRVVIGFYNGSLVSTLEKGYCSNGKKSEILQSFYELLQQYPSLSQKLVAKDYQLSIREQDSLKLNFYFELLNEIKIYHRFADIHIYKSGHAIDIIEKKFSKQSLVEYVKKNQQYGLLCIGDEGTVYENDFEFLSVNPGLSVKHQNTLGKSGWNLAPAGCTKVSAVEYYFGQIEVRENYFLIREL